MSTHNVPLVYPHLVNWRRFAQNDHIPQGTFMRRVAEGTNFVAAYRRKSLINYSRDWQLIPAGEAGTNVIWHGHFHAGYGVTRVEGLVCLAVSDDTTAANDPRVFMTFTPTGGGAVNTDACRYNRKDATPADTPNEFIWSTVRHDVVENTSYAWSLSTVDYGRPVAMCLYEVGETPVDDSGSGVVDPRLAAGVPILDTQQLTIHSAHTLLWRRNAAHILSFTQDSDATAPTENATTYTNVLDGVSVAVAADTPGYELNTRYHNTYAKASVPVRLAVLAENAVAGASADNAVKISDGTDEVIVSGFTDTAAWITADGTIPPVTGRKFDLMMRTRVVGGGEMTLHALAFYEYET